MKNLLSLSILVFFSILPGTAQQKLLTVAESSDYTSTSRYDDVILFIENLRRSSPFIRTESVATTAEGRDVPLIIVGKPLPSSPEEMKNDKRIVIYFQANIHAGEVEGKEAALMFARDLLTDKQYSGLLENVLFLICPVLNPDGNEKISINNRTHQNGPVNGVGVRYNGQNLDLNRDGMKAESPEIRGLLANVFNRWDPSVFVDCHTTNGSFHVEPVTFTWMVNPNGDRTLINYMRDEMMPAVSKTLHDEHNVENCFYGEFVDMLEPEKGWILDASEPRYITNYFGIRNRLGILNENYVYADYKSRVLGCYFLLQTIARYSANHNSEIAEMLKEADQRTVARGTDPGVSDSFAISYVVRPAPSKVTIRTYEAELIGVNDGWPDYRKTDRQKDVTVPYLIDYYPLKSVKFPFAYILTIPDKDIIQLLNAHGVMLEKLSEPALLEVQRFRITGLKGSERLNQGHYNNTISGDYVEEKVEFPAGSVMIRTAQPLANVAASLLEPQSGDGLATWNYFDKYLVPQWGSGYNPYPVCKVMNKTHVKTQEF